MTSIYCSENRYFEKTVATLVGLLKVNTTFSYMIKEDDAPWTKEEIVALYVECYKKLQKSFDMFDPTFRQQNENELVMQFESIKQKRRLFLIFKFPHAKDRVYSLCRELVARCGDVKSTEELFGSTEGFTVGEEGHISLKNGDPTGFDDHHPPTTIYKILKVKEDHLVVTCALDPGKTYNIMPKVFKKLHS